MSHEECSSTFALSPAQVGFLFGGHSDTCLKKTGSFEPVLFPVVITRTHTTQHPARTSSNSFHETMASAPFWVLSIPAGFALCFSARVLSLLLQINSGVPLKNEFPRAQPDSKEVAMRDTHGYVRRAYAAHQNSWEAMILWVSAVLVANAMGVDVETIDNSAKAWLVCRAVYIPAYTFIESHNASFFRTAVFSVSFLAFSSLCGCQEGAGETALLPPLSLRLKRT